MKTLTICKFTDSVICERLGVCTQCPEWERVLARVERDLDICPVCGVDRAEYREKFGREHICAVE